MFARVIAISLFCSLLFAGRELIVASAFSATLKSPLSAMARRALTSQSSQTFRLHFKSAIHDFIGRGKVPQHLVIEGEVLQCPGVVRIQIDSFFQISSRFGPFSLAALDRANGAINLGFVRQATSRDLEFSQ